MDLGFDDPYEDEGEPTLVAAPVPGMAPQAVYPVDEESSGVVVIPEVSELEAAASAPLPGMTALEPSDLPRAVTPTPTPAPALSRDGGRDLTDDGLPDVSALFFGGADRRARCRRRPRLRARRPSRKISPTRPRS